MAAGAPQAAGAGQLDVSEIRLARDKCLACGGAEMRPLLLLHRTGFPSGHPQHNFTYEHIVIARCQYCGAKQIEIFGHDCFSYDEVWDQSEWYALDAADGARAEELISECPSPLSAECACVAHQQLRDICLALPVKGWSSPLEAEGHVHSISLKIG